MPKVPIMMPQLGESIAEATIIRLNIAVGDKVVSDQEVIEVETNKATMGVTALCAGEVTEILAEEGVSYAVGSLLGILEVSEDELERTGEKSMEEMNAEEAQAAEPDASDDEQNLHFKTEDGGYREPVLVEPSIKGLPVPTGKARGALHISPHAGADGRAWAQSRRYFRRFWKWRGWSRYRRGSRGVSRAHQNMALHKGVSHASCCG